LLVSRADALRFGQRNGLRVAMHAVNAELVMQMGAGGEAGRAHVTDGLALIDSRAHANARGGAAHVSVQRGVAAAVLAVDYVAIAAFDSGEDEIGRASCRDGV